MQESADEQDLLLSSLDGETTNDIARIFGVSERTVRNTIHAFNAHGLDSIHPMDLSGRATIFTDTQREALLEILSRLPSEFGIDSRVWKLSDIAAAMENRNIAQGKGMDILNSTPALNEREVSESLIKLDPIWDELFPLERQRIVKLLVEQVTVNQNELDVRIRTDGIHSLITELKCNNKQMENAI